MPGEVKGRPGAGGQRPVIGIHSQHPGVSQIELLCVAEKGRNAIPGQEEGDGALLTRHMMNSDWW